VSRQEAEAGSGWRYAAAGLGWGVAVGAVTGVVVGVVLAVVTAWDAARGGGAEWLGLVVVLPLTGLVYGGALGAVAGTPGGLLNALVQPHVRDERVAWWSSWVIATLAALGVVLALAAWQVGRDVVDPPTGLARMADALRATAWAVPSSVVGGWLVARTSRDLLWRARDGERPTVTLPGPRVF
jgi:hypothetical protein